MKTDKHNMDLEQMLADVEHAGRDSRRQQALADMIDGMAGESGSSRKRGAWWWTARVAAAACILFFISTAVRIWFIPTESPAPMVAEAPTMEVPAITDNTIATPEKPVSARPAQRRAHIVAATPSTSNSEPLLPESNVTEDEETLPAMEEVLVEEVESTGNPAPAMEENTADDVATPVVSVAYNETPAVEPQPQEQEQAKSRRRSILGSLFRQPETDDMTGTVLAFRII